VDVAACTAAGVVVTATDASLSAAALAEAALGLALGLQRRVLAADAVVRGGDFPGWRPGPYAPLGLTGANVALLGWSPLAAALLTRLAGFAPASVTYLDVYATLDPPPPRTAVPPPPPSTLLGVPVGAAPSLPSLLAGADLVFLTVQPLTPAALHLLAAPQLALLKRGCAVVNVAAGSLVDEAAVAAALQAGALGGYAADVFACEDGPAFPDRPLEVPPALLQHPNTLFSPHTGGALAATRQRLELEAARSLAEALDGRRPGGALNEVPARKAGAPPPSGVVAPGGRMIDRLVDSLWCF